MLLAWLVPYVMCFVPLFVAIVESLGFDLVWFAILFIVSTQTAYISPPFGYNPLYMRAVAPLEIAINHLYKGPVPLIFLQAIGLALIVIFPDINLCLPGLLFGR